MAGRPRAKPFLKWAGGKTQLLEDLRARLPGQIKKSGVIKAYIEPFVGGGAFFFHLRHLFQIKEAHLIDINRELMLGYRVIKQRPGALIACLSRIEQDYLALDAEGRKKFYYEARKNYNKQRGDFDYDHYNREWIGRAAFLIFLNKTCFNGLFRQNKAGEFNVPHGRYKNPTICDAANIQRVSRALQGVNLVCADFLASEKYAAPGSFIYFDPPYRPLSETSSFTGYSKGDFTDQDQIRLADYFKKLDARRVLLMLSNSDPKASSPTDDFFDHLYGDFRIERVFAKRNINCDGGGRGEITELIITNY